MMSKVCTNMSDRTDYKRSYHTFNYVSNSGIKYRHPSTNNNVFENDEIESIGERVTFTIPSENISQLRNESEIKKVSLNTRINQIIKEHLDWHADAPEIKMHYVPKPFITKIVDQLSEPQLSEIARAAVCDLEDMSFLLRGEFSISSFLNIVENWWKVTRTPNRCDQNEHEYKILVKPDMGYKYSYLIKEVYRYIIEDRFLRKLEYYITDSILVLRIME
jgi:hypothetical protein